MPRSERFLPLFKYASKSFLRSFLVNIGFIPIILLFMGVTHATPLIMYHIIGSFLKLHQSLLVEHWRSLYLALPVYDVYFKGQNSNSASLNDGLPNNHHRPFQCNLSFLLLSLGFSLSSFKHFNFHLCINHCLSLLCSLFDILLIFNCE